MRKIALILFLSTFLVYQAQSQKVFYPDSNRQIHDLRAFTYALVDSLDHFSTDDMIAGKLDAGFSPYSSFPKPFPITGLLVKG